MALLPAYRRFRAASLGLALVALFAVILMNSTLAVALPVAPHVATNRDTDVCAMCHRSHTSASDGTWTSSVASATSGSALLAGASDSGDTGLCYTCHGVDTLGSGIDVQSSLETSSGHSLDPTSSAYGPSPKQCSSCHDSHGSAHDASGTSYPALLRSATTSGALVYSGDGYCTTCHTVRAGSEFAGLGIWSQTPHAKLIAAPSSGTGIVCSACHDPHGSPIAPSIRTQLATPSASAPTTITANDRGFCIACHKAASGTWVGGAAYAGGHASSTATVAIPGEWPAAGASRRVGECQTCHSAMGAADGAGLLVPAMLAAREPGLCYTCHRASGPAASNLASLAYSPSTPGAEVLALYAGAASPAAYGRLQVYARETTAAGMPVGPRELTPVAREGALVAGDIDGDGTREALVADASSAHVAVVSSDPLAGVSSRLLAVPTTAAFIAVGDVFLDGSGLPEVVTVSSAGAVRVLRYSGGAFLTVAAASVVGTPTSLAVGDVTGTGADDIAITTNGPDGLWILSENGATLDGGASPYSTLATPTAVAIGDCQPGGTKLEIAVANAGEASNVVTVFNGNGTQLASGGGPLPDGAATAILVGNVLPGVTAAGTSGSEIAVAYAAGSGGSGVRVLPQASGGGFGAPIDRALGAGANASALSLGDVDGDGVRELAVALAGDFTRTSAAVAPAVTVLAPNGAGDALLAPASPTYPAGGVELAGGTASVLVADIGAVGPSRHAEESPSTSAHVSTETASATRHVACSDCHDSHLASAAASSTPQLPGALIGALGVVPENTGGGVAFGAPQRAQADYEVCFKCHSGFSPTATRSIASEVSTRAASFHPVESGLATPTNATGATLTTATATGATISCGSCHGTSLPSVPAGPHVSPDAPLLTVPYFGVAAGDAKQLCLTCHRADVYFTGSGDGVAGRSGFFGGTTQNRLHSYHAGLGFACAACHVSHGSSTLPHLLRSGGFTWDDPAGVVDGECSSSCHIGGATHKYTRP